MCKVPRYIRNPKGESGSDLVMYLITSSELDYATRRLRFLSLMGLRPWHINKKQSIKLSKPALTIRCAFPQAFVDESSAALSAYPDYTDPAVAFTCLWYGEVLAILDRPEEAVEWGRKVRDPIERAHISGNPGKT